ncbi:MAG: biofilm PGA synthesis N-glycosyltransferase PgaC [Bacteroidia bacterium]|jgi:cellulose synthase/poly-beta-1,6-N-acetylglucosamine synthase-like glycosyltransferase
MILYVIIVLIAGLAYYILLSKYGELWSSIDETDDVAQLNYTVSILIPFRNEAENLLSLLSSLQALYFAAHSVQIVLVNDYSTDGGEKVIEEYAGELDIQLINQTEGVGKKAAIRTGWKACTGDIIIQTDADCSLPTHWLSAMLAPFSNEDISLACGPVQFHRSTNFWQRILALDFEALIAIGAAHIHWKKPMICNAANLAYRKSLITDADLNERAASGDDVFLLQSAHYQNPNGIVFVKNKKAVVKTEGPSNFSAFWHQRLRWASKNGDYDIKQNTWILVGVWMYNVLVLGSLFSFSAAGTTAAGFLVLLKVLAEDKFYSRFTSFFGRDLWFTNILLGQPFHILYMAIVPPLSQILKYQWKERKVS